MIYGYGQRAKTRSKDWPLKEFPRAPPLHTRASCAPPPLHADRAEVSKARAYASLSVLRECRPVKLKRQLWGTRSGRSTQDSRYRLTGLPQPPPLLLRRRRRRTPPGAMQMAVAALNTMETAVSGVNVNSKVGALASMRSPPPTTIQCISCKHWKHPRASKCKAGAYTRPLLSST
jgi:hypothetical protein